MQTVATMINTEDRTVSWVCSRVVFPNDSNKNGSEINWKTNQQIIKNQGS